MKGIITGYKNAILRNNEQVEIVAKKRLEICNNCPLKKVRFNIEVCGVCGCPLSGLTRQNEKVCQRWAKL